MRRTMLGGKIHRATVTGAAVDYEGSVTVDSDLLVAAGILPNEAVWIWDADNASRLLTYAIPGPAGSGVVCVNGAAAHLVTPGDRVIIATFVEVEAAEALHWHPQVAFVDAENHIISRREELAGQGAAIARER